MSDLQAFSGVLLTYRVGYFRRKPIQSAVYRSKVIHSLCDPCSVPKKNLRKMLLTNQKLQISSLKLLE